MSSLTLSLTPASSASNAAPATANDNSAAGPGAFHAMLSEQMTGGKAAAKSAPNKETGTPQSDKTEVTAKDKTDAAATAPPGEITPLVAAVPNVPIAAVPSATLAQMGVAIDVVAGKPQAVPRSPNLSKGAQVLDPGIASDAILTGPFDLRAGGAQKAQAQVPIEAKGSLSEGVATDFGAELNAMLTLANSAPQTETASIQPGMPPLGTLAPDATAAQTATPGLSVNTPVGTPGWAGELAGKITYLVGAKTQSAELYLNPAHLGPVEVRIHIGADQQTSIAFAVAHTDTLNALESALPRLREMFSDNGVNVISCSVSAESFAHNSQQGSAERRGSGSGNTAAGDLNTATPVERTLHLNGLVDVFA
jgi:flagellar hook-length control protein FliK